MYFPSLFQRQTIDDWLKAGSKNMYEVAHARVLGLLEKAGPVELPAGVDSELERALNHALNR